MITGMCLGLEASQVFVREATGLVRELSPLDVFFFGVVGVTPGVTLALFFALLPFLYPGVNMALAVVGAIFVSLIFGAT